MYGITSITFRVQDRNRMTQQIDASGGTESEQNTVLSGIYDMSVAEALIYLSVVVITVAVVGITLSRVVL